MKEKPCLQRRREEVHLQRSHQTRRPRHRLPVKAFGLRYQFGSRSNSRWRIRAPVLRSWRKTNPSSYKDRIALPAEMIKDNQQTGIFLVDARTHEIDDGDVGPRLTPRTNPWLNINPREAFSIASYACGRQASSSKARNFAGRGQFLKSIH